MVDSLVCDIKGRVFVSPVYIVILLVYTQPYGWFIFLNCTTAVMSQPKINCIHFHCPFHEGCIKILNDSITQITTFSFMWNYFANFVLLYTRLIDNHIPILEYFLILASLRLILSLDMYIFNVFVINCPVMQMPNEHCIFDWK